MARYHVHTDGMTTAVLESDAKDPITAISQLPTIRWENRSWIALPSIEGEGGPLAIAVDAITSIELVP